MSGTAKLPLAPDDTTGIARSITAPDFVDPDVIPTPVFIQSAMPTHTGPYFWIKIGLGTGGTDFAVLFEDGT